MATGPALRAAWQQAREEARGCGAVGRGEAGDVAMAQHLLGARLGLNGVGVPVVAALALATVERGLHDGRAHDLGAPARR